MTYLLPAAFLVALVIMIYAAVLAFRGERFRPVVFVLMAASLLWFVWELSQPL